MNVLVIVNGWVIEVSLGLPEKNAVFPTEYARVLKGKKTSPIKWLNDYTIGWLQDLVITWLGDCMITRLDDYMIEWLHDWVITRLSDYTIGWLHDWVITWLGDCMIKWLHDWMITWLHDWMITWLHAYMIIQYSWNIQTSSRWGMKMDSTLQNWYVTPPHSTHPCNILAL